MQIEKIVAGISAGLIFLVATSAQAAISFSGTGTNAAGHSIAAWASFTVDNTAKTITVVLRNDNSVAYDKYVPADALIGIFFNIDDNPALTYQSATAAFVIHPNDSLTPNAVVTSEWYYKHKYPQPLGGDSSPQVAQHYGLGTAGFGIFNTAGGQQFAYGVFDDLFTGSNGNKPVNEQYFVLDSITFVLSFTGTISESDISSVRFQYGTSLGEGHILDETGTLSNAPLPTPEPSTLTIFGLGIVGLGLGTVRRRRAS